MGSRIVLIVPLLLVIGIVTLTFLIPSKATASPPRFLLSPSRQRQRPAGVNIGDEIRQVALSVEDVHRRINKLSGGGLSPSSSQNTNNAEEDALIKKKKKLLLKRKKGDSMPMQPLRRLQDSIFVSIASFRDEQCSPTVLDMYKRAKYPEALFLGIVEQHLEVDLPCTPREFEDCQQLAFCPSDQIQVRRIDPRKARGPTFGRYIGMLMYRGEKYLLMIDSHNRFVKNWDFILVSMYKNAASEKAVISHYPEAWNNPDDGGAANQPLDNRPTVAYLCNAKFTDFGFPRLDGYVVKKSIRPRPQPWAAAGMLFADAKLLKEVPFDPYLDYIFDGEEILYSIRMWTTGWDIFSPSENVLYHYYYRTKAKKFWSILPPNWTVARDRAIRRIQYLLKAYKKNTNGERAVSEDAAQKEPIILKDLDKYGLGKARTLEGWYQYAGVDPVKHKIENKFCSKA